MYKGKARAHTNIALIKYWGKANKEFILPMNNSLSLTLDAFYTETTVTFSEDLTNANIIPPKQRINKKTSVAKPAKLPPADCFP